MNFLKIVIFLTTIAVANAYLYKDFFECINKPFQQMRAAYQAERTEQYKNKYEVKKRRNLMNKQYESKQYVQHNQQQTTTTNNNQQQDDEKKGPTEAEYLHVSEALEFQPFTAKNHYRNFAFAGKVIYDLSKYKLKMTQEFETNPCTMFEMAATCVDKLPAELVQDKELIMGAAKFAGQGFMNYHAAKRNKDDEIDMKVPELQGDWVDKALSIGMGGAAGFLITVCEDIADEYKCNIQTCSKFASKFTFMEPIPASSFSQISLATTLFIAASQL